MLEVILAHWVKIYAIVSLIIMSANWAMTKTYSKKDNFDALSRRVDRLENTVSTLPSKDDLHRLDRQLVELGAQITAITPQLVSIQRMTDLLTENELRGER